MDSSTANMQNLMTDTGTREILFTDSEQIVTLPTETVKETPLSCHWYCTQQKWLRHSFYKQHQWRQMYTIFKP